MRKRRVGAIAEYKAARRRIARERAAGIVSAMTPRPSAIRDGQGEFRVWRAGVMLAGPFDTREEAQAWIDER